jgi:hypothetical protein
MLDQVAILYVYNWLNNLENKTEERCAHNQVISPRPKYRDF